MYLELDDPFLRQAEVHPVRVFQVEGALVELGHGVVGIQQGGLFVHLTDDLRRGWRREGEV